MHWLFRDTKCPGKISGTRLILSIDGEKFQHTFELFLNKMKSQTHKLCHLKINNYRNNHTWAVWVLQIYYTKTMFRQMINYEHLLVSLQIDNHHTMLLDYHHVWHQIYFVKFILVLKFLMLKEKINLHVTNFVSST